MAADCPMSRTHTLRPGSPARQSGLRRWREGKVRPIPGSSPHDRPVSRVISLSPRRACDDPFHATGFRISQESYWAPSMRFLRHGGIYLVRWGSTSKPKSKTNPGSGPDRLPLVGPEPRQKNAPGGTRSFSSSADEFRPAIPRSGWSPPEPVSASPARTDYHALPSWQLKTGTFYFAGKRNFLLCLDSEDNPFRVPDGTKSSALGRSLRASTDVFFWSRQV
jgi:hypothetical protein